MAEIVVGEESKDLAPDERLQWLRARGITVETPEERKAKAIASIMKESDDLVVPLEDVIYVLVPADDTQPLRELTFSPMQLGDALKNHLQSNFFTKTNTNEPQSTSEDSNSRSKGPGHVEVFPFVHAVEGNNYIGVNLYFDQTARLKGQPVNSRALMYLEQAGYNPPPEFYGDVCLGRVKASDDSHKVLENLPLRFRLNEDLHESQWLQQATANNMEHTRNVGNTTGGCWGDDKALKVNIGQEQELGYAWTQTENDLELTFPLPDVCVASKDVEVKFASRHLVVLLRRAPVLDMSLFEAVVVDGSTWTLDKRDRQAKIVVTLEKDEKALWSRIKE